MQAPMKLQQCQQLAQPHMYYAEGQGGAKNFTAHVDRLKRYYLPEHLGTEEQPSLVTDRAPRSRLYEVHRVIAHRVTPEGRDYQVLWEPCADNDWDTAEITWEAEASLKCPERLQEYFK